MLSSSSSGQHSSRLVLSQSSQGDCAVSTCGELAAVMYAATAAPDLSAILFAQFCRTLVMFWPAHASAGTLAASIRSTPAWTLRLLPCAFLVECIATSGCLLLAMNPSGSVLCGACYVVVFFPVVRHSSFVQPFTCRDHHPVRKSEVLFWGQGMVAFVTVS